MELAELTNLPNGAHFVTADLHVHSFGASCDVTDPTMEPEAIVEAALSKGLGIVAITDHNRTDNISRALARAAQYVDRLLFVSGVEISTAHGHLLAFFQDLERTNRFLSRLTIAGRTATSDGHTTASMSDV